MDAVSGKYQPGLLLKTPRRKCVQAVCSARPYHHLSQIRLNRQADNLFNNHCRQVIKRALLFMALTGFFTQPMAYFR